MAHAFRRPYAVVSALVAILFVFCFDAAGGDASDLQTVSAQPAMIGDSSGSGAEWNEFFHSATDIFQPQTGYRISFDYKVLSRAQDATFYTLVRDTLRPDSSFAWQSWGGDPGQTGSVATTFVDRDAGKYFLIVGIEFQGKISISNLKIVRDPSLKPLVVTLPRVSPAWTSPGHATYYVDSESGSDAADGLSPANAWRTLARVNSGQFGVGDKILLRAGSAWLGYLAPSGSGSAGAPIEIGPYGSGVSPRIDAQGKWLAAVYLHNCQYVTLRGLDIANKGTVPQPHLLGVSVSEQNFGDAHDIVLDSLTIHDVTGSNDKSEGGGSGIDCAARGDAVPTRFDGLTIENCRLTRTDRNGITTSGSSSRADWYPSLHVVIKNNVLHDIGGDGIVPIACDGAVVEHNVLRGGRMRAQDYAAGIWPWSCDNTVVQYNDVSGMEGTNDGEGFDSDWNCRNTLFQYNFSHDNDGGFMLICDNGASKPPNNAGNVGTIVRYNVSVDDGLHTFNISGPCTNTRIYNNTLYIGKGKTVHIVASGNWGGSYADGLVFNNNIFYAAARADFDLGGMTNVDFDRNVYWGDIDSRPSDRDAIVSNPDLIAPGSLMPSSYRPLAGSPCIRAGLMIAGNGARDFSGNPVPAGEPPTIGAFQRP